MTHQLLTTWFRYVVVTGNGVGLLKMPQLLDVLVAPNKDELFIGAAYDRREQVVVLYRGNVEPLVVPSSWFAAAGTGRTRIDLQSISIVDHGQTIQVGDYEIAADAVLYEFDESYRKKARKRAVIADESLGGSIRRLRLQKGLTQSDLGLPMRTVARIERGEVTSPQAATLRRIASRLKVPLDALGTY